MLFSFVFLTIFLHLQTLNFLSVCFFVECLDYLNDSLEFLSFSELMGPGDSFVDKKGFKYLFIPEKYLYT